MSTLLGMTLFSAVGALISERIYNMIVGTSTDSITSAGRWAVFAGTWTTISTASGMRGASNSAKRLKRRTNKVRSLIEKNKGKSDGDLQ